ncbi:MAG: hypothetical protein ACK5Y2_00315 [Bdellovibrionales bacterium]
MKAFLSLLFLFNSTALWAAERATIQQIKDKRAIIRFDDSVPFSVGQEIFVHSQEGYELGILPEQRNFLERRNSIALSGNISKTTVDVEDSSDTEFTSYQVSATYGWNFKNFELGPSVLLNIYEQEGNRIDVVGLGGFFEYNLVPNVIGEDLIYGLRADYLYTSRAQSGDFSDNSSSSRLSAGGFAKWFIFSPVLAIKSTAGYFVTEDDGFRPSGFSLTFGIENYF